MTGVQTCALPILAKYWSFSFSISSSSEYSGLILFRMDWLDLLAVQGTLKRLFQYHQGVRSSNIITFCSVQSFRRVRFCDPMDCSTSGFPVDHQFPDLAQTFVRRVSEAIQPSHPVISFSSCLQSFPASESLLMSRFFTSGGQRIGASASASVLPKKIGRAHV